MRRSFCSALAVLLIAITLSNALSIKPKFPAEPVKANNPIMKSIDQIVKAFNEPDIQPRVLVEPVSSRGIVSDSARRRLDTDHSKIPKAKAQVPDPVQVSTGPIRINTAGGKRSRSLGEEDGVRTIEGVRTPDTEEDKVQTWRNARVIKGFLVPKDREANPHKKRQIYVQDATQFLAAQGLIPQQTSMDGSNYQTATNQQMYYTAQPQQTQYLQQQDGSIYGTVAPVQIQTVTAVPFTQQQQGQGQMYVLQADGTSYAPYNPVSFSPSPKSQFISRTGEVIQTATEQTAQASVNVPAQVPKPQVSIISKASPHHLQVQQQQPSRNEQNTEQKQDKLSQQQIQFQQAQQVLQQVQKQVEQQQAIELRQLQELQAQQQAEQQFQQLQQLQQASQLQQQQQQQQAAQAQQQQAAQIQQQQTAQIHQQQAAQVAAQISLNQQQQTILIPQGGSTLIQAPVQHDQQQQQQQHVAQIFQVQQPQQTQIQTMFQAGNGQTYILNHSPAPEVFEDRSSPVTQSPSQFIIKPQTYITGPGGQAFTVPVPIPSEQDNSRENIEHHPQRRPQQHSGEEPDSGERRHPPQRRRDHRERDHDDSHRRPTQTFMNRIMDAFTVKGNAMERVETNIALPVLASTGVFFGLGALAAGWFLSSANREVGILRRTGKPVAPGMPNVKRIRRSTPGSEVDQATFFQSIIQQAIEKQQKEYEEVDPEAADPKPSPAAPLRNKSPKKGIHRVKPAHSRNDYQDDHYDSQIDKVSHKPLRKSGFWLGSRQALNFAKVAIPAIILGGAVLAIGALIFGWYISGSNREIAFLEPSAYSRRKRDLTTTALSDGWLQRLLNSIHENPYENGASQSITNTKDSIFDPDTSKHSLDYHANLSDAVVAVSLAVVAFFSLMGIVLAWFFSENEKSNLGITGPYGFGGWPGNNYRSSRTRRSASSNDLTSGPHLSHNPSFLESILTNLEVSQNSILRKLQDTGYAKWQETPCAKRIFCDVMSAQSDDTVRAMEKRMSTFISMLPDPLSSSLSRSLGEVIMSIQRQDCSSYTCGGHWVDSSIIDQPSPPTNQNQPR